MEYLPELANHFNKFVRVLVTHTNLLYSNDAKSSPQCHLEGWLYLFGVNPFSFRKIQKIKLQGSVCMNEQMYVARKSVLTRRGNKTFDCKR